MYDMGGVAGVAFKAQSKSQAIKSVAARNIGVM